MTRPIISARLLPVSFLFFNVFVAIIYFSWWLHFDHVKNVFMYSLLVLGEIYHVLMAFTFWFTMRSSHKNSHAPLSFITSNLTVDIFVTVAGEPEDLVEKTLVACKKLLYPHFKIFLLNDSFVAGKENWQNMEVLAKKIGITCLTRKVAGGAKAGNINHALGKTNGDIIVIFDADMVPAPDFLQKTLPYFSDEKLAFVQTPQYYSNWAENDVTASAWEQQSLFFGPIMRGKDTSNAAFICGTNVAIRRTALEEVGGMCEDNIAEDFLTSLRIHQKGWNSLYHPEVLCEGLAPADLLSYYKQQFRWARGSLEVLFSQNPLFRKGLTWQQKVEYLSSGLYYLNGVIVLIDITIPVIVLLFGIQPVSSSTLTFALLFLPFIALNMFTLAAVTEFTVSLRALAFSQSSWTLQIAALLSVLTKQKSAFIVTPKSAQTGNFLPLVLPHIVYILLAVIASAVGIARSGLTPSVASNISWTVFNSLMFMPFIRAAYDWSKIKVQPFHKDTRVQLLTLEKE